MEPNTKRISIVLADSHGPVLGKDQTSANLSLLYLASYVKQELKNVETVYISQKPPPEFHLKTIAQRNADVYAVSFTSFSAEITYDLVKRIKRSYPDVIVVIGGPHVITHSKEALEKSGADICVIGEGEIAFKEIIQRLQKLPGSLSEIKSIAYLEKGKYKRTSSYPLIEDISTLPFPDRSLVNQNDFCGLTYRKARPNTEMVVTRGCPLRCVFCANPVFRLDNGPLFRTRTPEDIAAEAEELYQMGYREIYIHSDELNVDLKWSIEVCKALAALNHKDLYFQCNLRVIPMSEEFAIWLRKANFWMVRIGFESANDRVLKGIKKRMGIHKTEEACRLLSKQGIKVFAFLMMYNFWEEDGNLHHETTKEVRITIKMVYRLWRKGYLHFSSWAFAVPVHGAEMYDIAKRHGMIDDEYYPTDTWDIYEFLKDTPRKEFNAVYAAARRQTAIMALTTGQFEWRNYRGIWRKALTMVRGKPKTT